MMNHSMSSPNELEFTTSVDTSIQQNVPVPDKPPTLSNTSNTSTGATATENESAISHFLRNSGHPVCCIFHILFKALAVFVYLLGSVVEHSTNFITVTVFCILLLAADFWVVKNITGRLLVGLRWWAQVEGEDGTETKWIFESAEGTLQTNKLDEAWFWAVLYMTPLVWIVFFFTELFRWHFGWTITNSIAIALSVANVYGYWQCSKDQKAKFQQMVARGAEYGAGAAIRHNVLGRMANFAAGLGSGAQQTNGNAGQQRESTFV